MRWLLTNTVYVAVFWKEIYCRLCFYTEIKEAEL